MKFTSPARRAAAAAVLIGALGATGCSAINYQATTHVYSASDGTMFDSDDVSLRSIMFVAGEEGGPARVLGQVSNDRTGADASDAQVSISAAGETFDLTVEPGEAISLEHDEELIVPAIEVAPGSLQDITVTIDGAEQTFGATVLDGAIAEYRDLLPDGFDQSMTDHLIHGPDTWGGGAAHYDPDDAGH